MGYLRMCPVCGCSLDPEEICDCIEEAAPGERDRKAALEIDSITPYHRKGEMSNNGMQKNLHFKRRRRPTSVI